MDTLMIALLVKPFAFWALMAVIVAVEVKLQRVWPEGWLKRILFERNFDKRRPVLWTALVFASYLAMAGLVWVWWQVRDLF